MPRIKIDNREIEVPEGTTLLQAARQLGIDVPALCYLEGYRPNTSCMVCMMKIKGEDKLVPSCATRAEDGMEVESESAEIHDVRRTALELLLSDHAGDCRAPCEQVCPLGLNIPEMIRHVAAGRLDEAIATVREDIALPAVLGRLCPEYCENTCRREDLDDPASICLLKRYVADRDLASESPHVPAKRPGTGKRVAIVGAGPTGISAAYHLLTCGHDCTLIDRAPAPGGILNDSADEAMSESVFRAELQIVKALGVQLRLNTPVGEEEDVALEALAADFDAVLVAAGAMPLEADNWNGLPVSRGRLVVDKKTLATGRPGVFAAGDAIHPRKEPVHSVASGKSAAICIDQHLRGEDVTGERRLYSVRIRPESDELRNMAEHVNNSGRVQPSDGRIGGLTDDEARSEASRCLQCGCSAYDNCRLRVYAEMYRADWARFRGQRRKVRQKLVHPEIVYEPGKCILCGLCVQIAEQAREPLGLTFVGRGFDVEVGVPFDDSLTAALREVAIACADACPSGSLQRRRGDACEGFDHGMCDTCLADELAGDPAGRAEP